MKSDPCQKQACAIQYCLQKNKYQESACQAEIEALRNCCKKWSKESGCCAGVKLEENDHMKAKTHVPSDKPEVSRLRRWIYRNPRRFQIIGLSLGLTIFFSRPLYDIFLREHIEGPLPVKQK
ncbi:cx9C motif-containing protein 4 isoform X1 [Penaeus vannamei]|uniref:cx9C motif-containing protein 4 isoform X1 n=1 Tax=Penaeus vannamei TaxID=6689 RepID=UPI00387F97C2